MFKQCVSNFCLLEESLINKVVEVKYQSMIETDHMGLMIQFKGGSADRGPGFWKLNTSVINNESYATRIEKVFDEIEKCKLDEDKSSFEIWEYLKFLIAKISREYCKDIAKSKRESMVKLQSRIDELDLAIKQAPRCQSLMLQLQVATADLASYLDVKTREAMFRSKYRWAVEGEKSTKFFFSIEKQRYEKKIMSAVRKEENSELISDSEAILKEQARFYSKLYSKNNEVKFDLVNNSSIKISKDLAKKLDEPISVGEIRSAVMELKTDKTPGLDGVPAEFYQQFWERIQPYYLDMIKQAEIDGQLCQSARRGCITLLPKPGRDPSFLKNWRPITLLNTDYKILTKVIANRIKMALPDIISNDQTGFMQNRQITTTIRKTMDIIENANLYDTPGYVISIDFEKCFDKIEYSAILGSMRFFGFGEYLISLVALSLQNFWSCTINNGYTSDYFKVERSTHQGDPVAPYLFLLCGEVMSIEIKARENIKGITVYDFEQILSQFADDTQLFAENIETVNEYSKTLDVVYTHTGLRVNYEKSSIHCIGGAKQCQTEVTQNFVWSNDAPVILGVNTGLDRNIAFDEITNKVKNICGKWMNRSLTLMGKVLLVNSLMGSLYVYKMFVYANPDETYINRFENVINNFLWGGKRPKIKQCTLQGHKNKGGLGLTNMRAKLGSLKISWLFRSDPFTQNWIESIIPKDVGTLIFYCNIKPGDLAPYLKDLSRFWHQVLEAWFKFSFKEPTTRNEIVNQIIWYNSCIRVDDKILRNEKAMDRGLIFISDLLNGSEFKGWTQEYKENYDITWLEYRQIIDAIPKKWKKIIKDSTDESESTFVHIFDKLKLRDKVVKAIYTDIVNKNDVYLEMYYKLRERIGLLNDTEDNMERFRKGFVNLYKISGIVKYRDFQYRLLTNDIHCNNRLYYWKIKNTKMCDICNLDIVQDVKHLLFECIYTKKVWNEIIKFFEKIGFEEFSMEYSNIFLNDVFKNTRHPGNLIVLVVKQMIFAAKCLSKKISIVEILLKIEEIEAIEYRLATKKARVSQHVKRWGRIINHNLDRK